MFKFYCYLKDRPPPCATLTREEENCIRRDWAYSCKTWQVHAMPRCSSTVTQGGIRTATGESYSKWYLSHIVAFFLSSHSGTLEPEKIWRAVDQVDCHLGSALWRGRETWAGRPSWLCQSISIVTQNTQPVYCQASHYEDGGRRSSRNEGIVCGTLTYWQCFSILTHH